MTKEPHKSEADAGYPAEKARQGQIILTTRIQRVIFIAGLAGIVVLVLVIGLAS